MALKIQYHTHLRHLGLLLRIRVLSKFHNTQVFSNRSLCHLFLLPDLVVLQVQLVPVFQLHHLIQLMFHLKHLLHI